LEAGTEIRSHMVFNTYPGWTDQNLGRFRLSVHSDPVALDQEQTRLAAMRLTDPWAALGAAYAMNGRNEEASRYFGRALQRADGYEARKPILAFAARFDEVLAALSKRQPGDAQLQLAFARKLAERGKQRLADKQPAKAQAELEKSRAIFTRLLSTRDKWTILTPTEMKAETGAKMELQKDGSVFVHQPQPAKNDTYTLVFQTELKAITGLRLEALADSRLPNGGPGWARGHGNFVLNELTLHAAPADSPDKVRAIALPNAWADHSQPSWDVRGAVDGNARTGWAILPEVNKDHTAVFEMAEPIGDGQPVLLTVRLIHQFVDPDLNLGRFRLSFTNDAITLQATRVRLDLKDSELLDFYVALGGAHVQQRRTNEAVASFTEALALAADRAAKAKIITEAAPLKGVLKKLAERAAGDGQFQAELARHFAERGNAPLAEAARTKARALFEKKLAKEPDNSAWAAELADVLLIDSRAKWAILKPTEIKSEGGATLMLQPDGSILAGGKSPDKDVYTVEAEVEGPVLAVKLEALPHATFPSNGPGRHDNGNFHLNDIRVQITPGGMLDWSRAFADFEQMSVTNAIDTDPNSAWAIAPMFGKPHWAVFIARKSVGAPGKVRVQVRLDMGHTAWARTTIGRFRLSVSGDPTTLDREEQRFAAMKLTDPWARLAVAYAETGRNDEALQYFGKALKRADGYEGRKPIIDLAAHFDEVLSALIQRQPEDPQLQLALARKLAERGKRRLAEKQPVKAQAALEKSRVIFTRLRAKYSKPQWTVLTPTEMKTETGAKMELQKDGSVFVQQSQLAKNDTYSLVFRSKLKGITDLRLEVLADARLPNGGPGWVNGNFVLNELTLEAAPADSPDKARAIALRNARADHSQAGWDVTMAVDGNGSTGWALWPEVNKDRTAVFALAEQVGDGKAARLTVRLNHQHTSGGVLESLGRFRLSFTNDRATLQATRIRLDLKDSELVDCNIALAKAHARQARTKDAVASFAEGLPLAADRAGKAKIIAEAAPLKGVLEKLAERAVRDAQFQAELARHYAERGNAPLADSARAKARALFEGKLAKEPQKSAWAAELAEVLLIDSRAKWTILKPTQMKSEGGATLTLLDDSSILAGGKNPDRDVYSLVAKTDLKQIHAIRLEALPDPSLPGGGPGRVAWGNFHLGELRVFSGGRRVTLTNIIVVYDEAGESRKVIAGGAHGTLGWGNVARTGKSNTAIVATRLQRAPDNDLKIEMYFSPHPQWTQHGLGRFRLSVSADPAMFERERKRLAARKITDSWAELAAAYHISGDQPALGRLLKRHPAAAAGIGDLYAAAQDYERAIAEYRKVITDEPADRDLLIKLATAYQAAGRTREAIPHLAKASAADPKDTLLSLKLAALQAWFGQEKELADTRQRILAFAKGKSEVLTVERAAKACSILPTPDKEARQAALALGRKGVKLGMGGEGSLLALGMAEYRSGNHAAAEEALRAAAKAGPNNPHVTGTAAFYQAMSLFRQGKKVAARKLAISAAVKMKPLPADEKNPLTNVAAPVGGGDSQEYLILWLAHKEAKALIKFEAAPRPKGRDGKK
jgi:tetratricopeptide (TPR) repeat protein